MNLPGGRNALVIGALTLVTAGAVLWSVTGSTTKSTGAPASSGSSRPASSISSAPVPVGDPAKPVLGALATGAPVPTASGLTTALEALLRQSALGPHVGGVVIDAATGDVLFGQGASSGYAPASTAKLLTAVAVLGKLGPDFRIETKVVDGGKGQLILVGGGDPTLSLTPPVGFTPAPASMPELARATLAAAKAKGLTTVTVGYDSTAFAGARTADTWPAEYVTSGVVSPVTALMVDEGRIGPIVEGTGPRVVDPPASAARSFVKLLQAGGLKVAPNPRPVTASSQAATVASVKSPPLSDLIGWMLSTSDNDLAEALSHLLGAASGGSASFAGGAAAVSAQVTALGISTDHLALFDGSGLSNATRVSPASLAEVLSTAAKSDQANLRAIITGLPVAGFTGTLETRYLDPSTRGAAGLVRAKTGTLRTVGALAGTVVDASGRQLIFAFLADQVPVGGTLEGRAALDRIAAKLVSCGCS